ncbi:BREX-2 system adenine-specific DNA-methyltransferase PglX [Brevibacterium otitidis]|uniref:site-specific DNA-methyltransferase (adenine-specific) n=1 Tax=Brevibacterium otitidis TaxID=53364 RepID=A0ABV5X5V1_9MICO|nr:BREX-2 system adenine-specific DNA-methyltransferase PglX [Brevibacterium otitidis]
MTATDRLTPDLKAQVLALEDDLRKRVGEDAALKQRWQAEHRDALEAQRTAASWTEFLQDRLTQAAVAWALTSVFIRFCEDNGLVAPVWIAGPPDRRQEALDAQLDYFRQHPEETDRDWLLQAVRHLRQLPATAALVDDHSPLWQVAPSGQAITRLLDFWRAKDDHGELVHDLRDETLSTRFLGDLYQDLSDHAKKTYALLQTPVFVEEFILDQTLEPALAERPLEGFRLIDPTCGSGHFLLGAFDRFVDKWREQDPGLSDADVVERSLDAVHGVDVNPFAVAIARFRLTVAATKHSGLTSLENAPSFPLHLAVGDSLLHDRSEELNYGPFDADAQISGFTYTVEDLEKLRSLLRAGSYDVVVGNPPYITVKDKTLNQRYREIYDTCKGTYALTVPFMERFFELAKPARAGEPAGWTGQITSNSFMKREFGSKIIEEFLVRKDLRLVADTSGAYIPGHGTPTVIITGRNQAPLADTVRAVLGVRGEPGRPAEPENGLVWRALADHVDASGYEDEWVTVADLDRSVLGTHPWSLTGGGASDLLAVLNNSSAHLGERIVSVGRTTVVGEDDAWVTTSSRIRSMGLEHATRPLVVGENVRDFALPDLVDIWWPYEDVFGPTWVPESHPIPSKVLWPARSLLKRRVIFGQSLAERNRPWYDHLECYVSKMRTPFSITFAEVATHNHFVLDRGGKVFKQTAPVIKLPAEATEDEHLELLALLNSSTACFWLKQNCYPKGGDPIGQDGARVSQQPWSDRYQFNGANVQAVPLPSRLPLDKGRLLDALAQQSLAKSPAAIADESTPTASALTQARMAHTHLRGRMIAEQEELDWQVYHLYGLLDQDLNYSGDDLPDVALGERAFEIVLARKAAAYEVDTSWFERHRSTPVTEIPGRWPAAYRELVQRRIDLIESDRSIGLLERPEYKRRWASEPWDKQQERALRGWLLDRLEDRKYWFDAQGRPAPRSIAQLADLVARDSEVMDVLALWEGRRDLKVTDSLTRLLVDEAVPYLAAYRLKETGLRKRTAWEHTWDLQRREDAGEKVGTIPVPPKYTSADFRKASWWQARGKLDVPKERFILYPDAGRATDPTALLGWAGWDHAEQALALNIIIGAREAEGVDDEQLVPLVAGLAELQPWVEQWHSEADPTYGMPMAEFTREQLRDKSLQVGKTAEELAAWRPAPTRRGRRARS